MTEAIEKILAGYLDLFIQRPAPITEVDSTGQEIDSMNMARDWQNVGSYLNNAMIEWDGQRNGGRNVGKE